MKLEITINQHAASYREGNSTNQLILF